jgi:hypothetical protein
MTKATYYFEEDNKSGSGVAAWDECYVDATSETDALAQLENRGVNVTHLEQVQN